MFLILILIILSYLIGSLSFALIISKLMKLKDPRTYGSKNPGATNVLRSGSKLAAILTLLLDMLKSLIPVLLIKYFNYSIYTLFFVIIAVFLGHLYPIFFKFKGGKGVATALGVLLGINWILGLLTLISWILIAFISRYSSLSALISAILVPIYYILLDNIWWDLDKFILVAIIIISALLIFRHSNNISNLLKGKETKISFKK